MKYADPIPSSVHDFFVGAEYAYKFAPLQINATATTVSLGTVHDITYTLSKDAPDSFFVQAKSGVIFGTFEFAETYTFSLLAVDKAGKSDVVEQYTFNPINRGAFRVVSFTDKVGAEEEQPSTGSPRFTDPSTTTPYAVGTNYKFAPLEITGAEHTDDVLSDLEFSLKDAPAGFLINPNDGYIQGTPTARGEHTMQLFAVDSLGNSAVVKNITLSIKPRDVDVAEYGPNEQECANHGTPVDAVLFDEAFTCDCNATAYSGGNCEVPALVVSAAVLDSDASNAGVPIAIGTMLFLVLVGIAGYKRRLHLVKMKAFDFDAELARLIASGEIDPASDDDSGPRIPREIKRSNVTKIEIVGEGAFGEVRAFSRMRVLCVRSGVRVHVGACGCGWVWVRGCVCLHNLCSDLRTPSIRACALFCVLNMRKYGDAVAICFPKQT